MTRLGLYNKILKYTKQNSNQLPASVVLADVNDDKNEIMALLTQRDIKGNYFMLPQLADFIAGQREYSLPDYLLNHSYTVEVAFSTIPDPLGNIPYVKAFPDDFRRHGMSRTEENIISHYTNVYPRYEIQRRSIYLLSGAIDATTLGTSIIPNAVRIIARMYPSDLPDLSDNTTDMSIDPTPISFGIPIVFQELIARRYSIEWKGDHPGAVPLSPLELRYDADLEAALSGIEMNDMSDEIIGRYPKDNGQEY